MPDATLCPRDPAAEANDLLALYQQRRFQEVAERAARLTQRAPHVVAAWSLLGAACQALGRLDDAAHALEAVICLRPDDPTAHTNLGILRRAQGWPEMAIRAYHAAIALQPANAAAHYNLGVILQEQGRLDEAIPAYQQAIAARPDYLAALNNLGSALRNAGRREEAIAAYQRALAIWPDYVAALTNLGSTLREVGRLEEAAAALQRALAIQPNDAVALTSLGNVWAEQGRADEAIAAHQRALASQPSYARAYYNLGHVLQRQGRLVEAATAYRTALSLQPDLREASNNLGEVLQQSGRPDEAVAAYEVALQEAPDYAEARWNRAVALLTLGRYREGWQEHEWRWRVPRAPSPRVTDRPPWLGGEAVAGRRILLWGEQGLGDQLQFARYAPLVAALGGRVVLEVAAPLVRLLGGIEGMEAVRPLGPPSAEPAFDAHCPLMSLPLALGTDLATIPKPLSLKVPAEDVTRWARRLGTTSPRIGVVWSGNPQFGGDRHRSMSLAQFRSVFDPNASWISLQKDVLPMDQPTMSALPFLQHVGEDFLNTAAICELCDLVISVDTSIAHLAATLGRPVWVLLPHAADWRWLRVRNDTPWYPTARLYRQERPGDWDGVLNRVQRDLRAWREGRLTVEGVGPVRPSGQRGGRSG